MSQYYVQYKRYIIYPLFKKTNESEPQNYYDYTQISYDKIKEYYDNDNTEELSKIPEINQTSEEVFNEAITNDKYEATTRKYNEVINYLKDKGYLKVGYDKYNFAYILEFTEEYDFIENKNLDHIIDKNIIKQEKATYNCFEILQLDLLNLKNVKTPFCNTFGNIHKINEFHIIQKDGPIIYYCLIDHVLRKKIMDACEPNNANKINAKEIKQKICEAFDFTDENSKNTDNIENYKNYILQKKIYPVRDIEKRTGDRTSDFDERKYFNNIFDSSLNTIMEDLDTIKSLIATNNIASPHGFFVKIFYERKQNNELEIYFGPKGHFNTITFYENDSNGTFKRGVTNIVKNGENIEFMYENTKSIKGILKDITFLNHIIVKHDDDNSDKKYDISKITKINSGKIEFQKQELTPELKKIKNTFDSLKSMSKGFETNSGNLCGHLKQKIHFMIH